MTARRRMETVFAIYAMGAKTRPDPPLMYYVHPKTGKDLAVVVDLPVHLTFREGGRPRYAHVLPDPVTADGFREGYRLLRCPDLDLTEGPDAGLEQNWWFKFDPQHARQQNTCTCDMRPAWGTIDCPEHGLVGW